MRFGLAILAASLACGIAPASAYTTIFAFGDSLSDAGNISILDGGTDPVSPPYFDGHFSNGRTWVEDLSRMLGLGALKPSLAGGHDFAYGGAQTGPTAIEGVNPGDLLGQVATYAAFHRGPEAGALYTIDIGGNDIINALGELEAGKISLSVVSSVVAEAETNTVDAVDSLFALGARNLLFYEIPNLGLTPRFDNPSTPLDIQTLASDLAQSFDATVLGDLHGFEAGGLKVYDLDTYDLLDQAIADPAEFGFTNVSDPCWTGNFTNPSSGTLCSPTRTGQDKYLFWDEVHPTAAAHKLTAEFAYDALTGGSFGPNISSTVPEPSTWAMLALGFLGLGGLGLRKHKRADEIGLR